ncbi:MAG: hypothetical protein HY017_27860 [Betaproteobacteria bacterium]|nr:hypothetical protein [Betaproteobacteria bacterium]
MPTVVNVPSMLIVWFTTADGEVMVIAPLSVRVTPELTVIPLAVAGALSVIDVAAASAVTVTVWPVQIVTVSPATGKAPAAAPPHAPVVHVLLEFQSPLATRVL